MRSAIVLVVALFATLSSAARLTATAAGANHNRIHDSRPLRDQSPCPAINSCQACVSTDYCGWCSPNPVVFRNGTVWARCADQRISGWDCKDGIYQKDTCVQGYQCDVSGKCTLAAPGEGMPLDVCQQQCSAPPSVYLCNATTLSCDPVPPGTQGATSKDVCVAKCVKSPPAKPTPPAKPAPPPAKMYTCDIPTLTCKESQGGIPLEQCTAKCVKHNNTPSALVGDWIGIQVGSGYEVGEAFATFEEDGDFSLRINAHSLQGSASFIGDTGITVTLSSGGTINGIYVLGPSTVVTKQVIFAFAAPGQPAPSSLQSAFQSKDSLIFNLAACLDNEKGCDFSSQPNATVGSLLEALEDPLNDVDRCNVYTTCGDCVQAPLCGWCSVPVNYTDGGVTNAQCAGVDQSGKASPPWECHGRYSRSSCDDLYVCDAQNKTCSPYQGQGTPYDKDQCARVCGEVFLCDKITLQCTPVPPGTPGSTDIDTCRAQCVAPKPPSPITPPVVQPPPAQSPPPQPIVPPPVELSGLWRGVQVDQGRVLGEFQLNIEETGGKPGLATFREPSGQKTQYFLASQPGSGADIVFIDGKTGAQSLSIYTTTPEAGEFTILNLVMGSFGKTTPPPSYIAALSSPELDKEFLMWKCNTEDCTFSPASVVGKSNSKSVTAQKTRKVSDGPTFTWIASTGGDWTNAGYWSPAGPPTVGSNVDLTKAGAVTVTIPAGFQAKVASVTVGGGATLVIFQGSLAVTDSLNINTDGSLTLSGAGGTNPSTLDGLGTASVDISGSLKYTAGSVTGVSAFTVDGLISIEGADAHTLTATNLICSGSCQWSNGPLALEGKSTLQVNGGKFTWVAATSAPLLSSDASGTVLVSSSDGLFVINANPSVNLILPFTASNGGVISVSTGSVTFSQGLTSTGASLSVDSGATVLLNSPMQYSLGDINGLGMITIDGAASAILSGDISIASLDLKCSGGVQISDSASASSNSAISLGQGATLATSSPFTMANSLQWDQGTLQGGSFTVNNVYGCEGLKVLNKASLTITGEGTFCTTPSSTTNTLMLTGSSSLVVQSGASLVVGSAYQIAAGAPGESDSITVAGSFLYSNPSESASKSYSDCTAASPAPDGECLIVFVDVSVDEGGSFGSDGGTLTVVGGFVSNGGKVKYSKDGAILFTGKPKVLLPDTSREL